MSNLKIALIEDEEAICELYRLHLESNGYEVGVAVDGEAGIALIKEFKPHVVLLDLMLPKVDGFKILESMPPHPHPKPKVIVLTNMGDEEVEHRVMAMGADSFMIKINVTPTDVTDHLQLLLSEEV